MQPCTVADPGFHEIDSCLSAEASGPKMADGRQKNRSFRFQLEKDVHRLQQLLQEEMELRIILENALEHAAGALQDSSRLPHDACELLSNIAMLEVSISRLEEEMVSLHFQLVQERNERRIAEYRLKQLPSNPLFLCSSQGVEKQSDVLHQDTAYCDVRVKDLKISAEGYRNVTGGKIIKEITVEDLWNYPNRLSEEMVRCMKNIFVTLAESSDLNSKSSSSGSLLSTASPYGHLSNSSFWSLPESPSTVSSWQQSPQVELQCSSGLLATENTFDPYKVRGKQSWADIGNYSLAIEVSWMSVGKKQMEYASGALRRFRSLIEQLAKVNPVHLSGNEKLAFWINLYNALMMHAYLAYGVPRSDCKLFSLMQKATYTVGGHSFSAAAIEYVVLKMKPPVHRPQTALLLALHKLKVSEDHRKFSIEKPEPLVAFALSSGMYSSPAVRIYSPENVREELQEAQRDYIRASVGVSNKGKLLVPKMLDSFARGIVDDTDLAAWICRFLPPQQATFVEQCMSQRRQSFLGSRNCSILPHDSRFRYLFLPEVLP